MKINLADIAEQPVHNNTAFKKPLITQGSIKGNVATFNYARVVAGKQLEIHRHPDGEEYYLFIKGSGEMLIGDNWIKVSVGDFVIIPVNNNHSVKNNGKADLIFITLRTINK